MLKKLMLLGAIAASALAVTTTAFAGGGNSQNARDAAACVQAGIGTLVSLGLIDEAARGQIDYDTLDSDTSPYTSGAINANLPARSYLPLRDVVALHRTNPELFDWCA
jgi:hypothetical protein